MTGFDRNTVAGPARQIGGRQDQEEELPPAGPVALVPVRKILPAADDNEGLGGHKRCKKPILLCFS